MRNYLIGFPDEERALIELEPFGYAHIVAPIDEEAGGEVVYAWDQGSAMVGGTGVILSYKQQGQPAPDGGDPIPANVPTLAPGYWVSLLSEEADDALWDAVSPSYPAIEFSSPDTPGELPSDWVVRSANLTFDVDAIKGISPVWSGTPDLGWPYDSV